MIINIINNQVQMSQFIGVRVVFGVEVDANSIEARKFVSDLMSENEHIPQKFFDNFDDYYNHHVLESGTDPDHYNESDPKHCELPEDYNEYFDSIIHSWLDVPNDKIKCYRQACCLSKEWKKKIVVGIELISVKDLWISPVGVDLPTITADDIQNVKSQLAACGFSTDTKTFFILNDCISCS